MVKKIDFTKAVIIGNFFQLTWVPFSITSGVQILLIFRVAVNFIIRNRIKIFHKAIIKRNRSVVVAAAVVMWLENKNGEL